MIAKETNFDARPSVALLVNQVSPYRVRLFSKLAERFELTILHGGMESNRPWKEPVIPGATSRKVAGWTLTLNRRAAGKVMDQRFLHIEPGYVTELLRLRPSAIITSEIGFRTLLALSYGAVFRIPVWVWWGGTIHTERHLGLPRRLIRRSAAKWVRYWISYGQTSTEYLLSLGIARRRILQVQNCVDEEVYSKPVAAAMDLEPKPVLLHAGRLVALKGIASFLSAAARAQAQGLEFSILLVGDGPDQRALEAMAFELGLRNLRFHPAQPAEAMPAIYRSADVLVFPTLSDVWGLVANEGVLSGIRVLCSKYAGCAPELFESQCIFDPLNEDEFAAALRKAVEGTLPRADPSRLTPLSDVGEAIADAVLEHLPYRSRS